MNKVSPKRYIPTGGQAKTVGSRKNIFGKTFKRGGQVSSKQAKEKMPNMLDWKNLNLSPKRKYGRYSKVGMPVVKQQQKNNQKDKNSIKANQQLSPFKAVPISTYSLASLVFLLGSLGLLLYATYVGTETQRISGLIKISIQELYAAEETYAKHRETLEGHTSGFWEKLNNGSMRKVLAKDITVVDFSHPALSSNSSAMVSDKKIDKGSNVGAVEGDRDGTLDATFADSNVGVGNERERAIAFKKIVQESSWVNSPDQK